MAFINLDQMRIEARRLSDGTYVVDVDHADFGSLYEIWVTPVDADSVDVECIERVNNVTVDVNTLDKA